MLLARRSALRPTPEQARALGRSAGTARFAWNWALARRQEAWALRKAALAAGVPKELAPKVPTAVDLHKELVILKNLPPEDPSSLAWMYSVSKCCPQESCRDIETAYDHAFRRIKKKDPKPGFPRFKSRFRDPGHFRLTGSISVANGRIKLPRIGSVRIMPGDVGYIQDGSYSSVSVVEDHGRWFVSVRLEIPEAPNNLSRPIVGLDAGVRELAHLSDGTVIPNPRALVQEAERLRKAKFSIARKQRAADKRLGVRLKGQHREESKRLKRERSRKARLEARVANIRTDALHKATTLLAKTYSVIVVEDLHGKNMTKARKGRGRAAKAGLNRVILDSGMLRLKPLLAYKMPLNGGRLVLVPAAYTSRRCSHCGALNDPGSSKTYKCEKCGLILDRDQNASLNILAAASLSAEALANLFSREKPKPGGRGVSVRPKDPNRKVGSQRQRAMIRQLGTNEVVR